MRISDWSSDVCSSDLLPFSDDKGEGFENKIAELIAGDLGVPLEYTWFPQTIGFVRMTLAAKRCDLIIGVATPNELMQNTNPYYRSGYVIVHRPDLRLAAVRPDDQLGIASGRERVCRSRELTVLAVP